MLFRGWFEINLLILQSASVRIFKQILVWIEEQTYWIAHRFLILGFELDLYSPGEYCMVYWYLYVILIKLSEKTQIKMSAADGTGRYTYFLICDDSG